MKQFLTFMMVMLTSGAAVHAITLDWNDVTWTAGALSASFEVDGNNPGDDITITISGDTGDRSAVYATNPAINSILTGGQGTGQESLYLGVDYDNPGSNELIITITFNYTNGVNNVAFKLFDVDRDEDSDWRDLIDEFEGTNNGVHASWADLTHATGEGEDNDIDNSGTATANVEGQTDGDVSSTSNNANVNVTYNDGAMDQVTFRWSNTDDDEDFGFQHIALYDITYTPVIPEPSVVWGGALLFAIAGWQLARRGLRSSSRPAA